MVKKRSNKRKRKLEYDDDGSFKTKRRTYDDIEYVEDIEDLPIDDEDKDFLEEESKDTDKDVSDLEEDDFENLDDEDDLMDDFEGGEQVMDKHKDLLRQLTNFDPYLKETVNGWLGIYWNEEEKKFMKQPGVEPIMNVNCAAWCVSFLKTYTRENNIITDISKDNYIYIVSDIVETLWLNLGTRDKEFGLNSEGDILRVAVELQHAAELVLMGAGDGRYNKFLGSTYNSIDRSSNMDGRSEKEYSEPIRRQGFFKQFVNSLGRKQQTG